MSILPPDRTANDRRNRLYRDASRAAGIGLIANATLVALKLAGGLLTGSNALIADAVNSMGDVAGSVVVRGALWVAQREADADHPYGHTKAESIAGLTVAVLIVLSALALGLETLRSFLGTHVPISVLAAGVAGISAILKEMLYWYTIGESRRLQSTALQAVAWDHRCDALSSGAIALALLLGASLGGGGWLIDRLAALVMCIVLIVTGARMYLRTARELMDQQAESTLVQRIAEVAAATEEVHRVEKLRVRKSGLEFFVEIHVEVDGQSTVEHGHRVGHAVKDHLINQFPRVRDVHVHIEPSPN
jgi:cation diffusion facilitator family transporter